MNGRITITIIIGFIFTFSSLFLFSIAYPEPSSPNHPFYNQKFDPSTKKILFLGSSHVANINNSLVTDYVILNNGGFEIFNLAYGLDTPKNRIKTLTKIVSLEPEIVFYGVSYRDFSFHENEKNPLPDPSKIIDIDFFDLSSINPKINTLKMIRNGLKNIGFVSMFGEETRFKTPFLTLQQGHTVATTDEELRKISKRFKYPEISVEAVSHNDQVQNFKKIINELQKNDIKVVIFTTPLSGTYLSSLPQPEKNNFNMILENVKQEHNVKIYNFTAKYADLQIWTNLDHVVYNESGMIYSKDIAKMVNKEILS